MSKSALSRPRVQESVGRSAADLSTTKNFSQSAGMIIPILERAFIAGTDGYIDRRAFTRTKTPLFPAFQSVTQHVDAFLVPLRYLYTPMNDWKLNINDINSSRFNGSDLVDNDQSLMASVPRMDFGNNLYVDLAKLASYWYSDDNLTREALFLNDANRLFDMLDYGQKTISTSAACQQNLFMLAAYQKVYFDHFRNTAYTPNNPLAYNLDWLWKKQSGLVDRTNFGGESPDINSFAIAQLCKLRYVNYRNDYFHNIYPALNYVASTPVGSWSLPSDLSSSGAYVLSTINNQPVLGGRRADQSSTPSIISGRNQANNDNVVVSAQQIRAIFALDKLMRASAYTPKHVKDQFKARFDVDVPDSVGMESIRVGSWQNDIVFGEVTSTSNTYDSGTGDGDSLGAIGGKGVGSAKDDRIHFHCKEDSILVVVQYFMPLAMYDSDGVSQWNIKLAREDFFQPEFQNLGLRPLYRKELVVTGDSTTDNLIIGYTVPNQYYKVPINKNTGVFNKKYLNFTYVEIEGVQTLTPKKVSSPLRAFTVHTTDVIEHSSLVSGVSSGYFKVNPSDLDYLFEESFDVDMHDMGTDQFFGQYRLGIQLTHNMSVHGQPSI